MYSTTPTGTGRNLQLDILRGVAIASVLSAHSTLFRKPTWDAIPLRASWTGVDLFFVLSGFLISGLLFSEHLRNGTIDFRRFAIRRVLKIWPALYFLLLITVPIRLAVNHFHGLHDAFKRVLSDVFFLQSYRMCTWGQCWSLGVEEHFYIFLPVLLWLLLRSSRVGQSDPFRALPKIFVAVAVAVLVIRLITAHYFLPYTYYRNHFPTHLRIDSLFFGVILSYYSHFQQDRFASFVRTYYWPILAAGLLLLSPAFVLEQSARWMYTFGFTSLYLGFGALLVAALYAPIEKAGGAIRHVLRLFAYVGTFSYSIYLWHVAWLETLQYFNILQVRYWGAALYYGGSIAVGVLMAKLVEVPVIRLRDRIFPRRAALVEVEPASPADRREAVSSASHSAGP